MRLKDGLILREVAGQYVIIPTGKRVREVTEVLYMTKPAAALWNYMQNHDFEKEDLIKLTMERYADAVNNGELVPSARSNCTTLPKQEYRLAGWLYRSATALCQRCEPLFR